ncbi:ParB/RepB/Spo0J family partition protein [Candidatus Sulfidibacterium hydrothermale]|uniref:ParB/RepB/Spo0J family partition protein n=1 Tax=Candidatus Sulfidibacterium hydrothermale TaxID=2875962 RepID=UPI001F0A3E25|nr:ParB/RepB/Spo0J family partition protein [Candidatus Sulfidibacterium hydrothermale]UBM63472.1 ParB/RepB/Spo0J family partition protein [Candidatus Sulfidibacterium hydrothermale]
MTTKKTTKRVLGRGLDAILSSPETDITSKDISGNYVAGAIAELDLDQIEANPFQPRTDFDETMLQELAESIKSQGVIQPVTVRKMGREHYQLIAGERRLKASRLAGLKTIPAFIRVANDEQMLEMALIENIHRQNLNAIEVAISYKRLIEECQLTQEQLSEKVGKNRTTITNFLRLLKLPPEIQIALRDGTITMGHARALLSIEQEATQLRLLKLVLDEGLSVRQVEHMVREINHRETPSKKQKKQELPEKYKEITRRLSDILGTKVSLKRNTKGAGTLVISFKNDEGLSRVVSALEKK